MRVLVTGGCGYIGSVLVPKLLKAGHEVTVRDLEWFGNHLKPHPYLDVHEGDFRWINDARPWDAVIHLAAVANDPTGDLDPKLTWEVNALGTMRLMEVCARSLIKQFIYASSGSVYGVSDAPQVTENTPLEPVSEYNKTKMVAERCVLSYATPAMSVQIIRPATVCGFSPRMRLDVVVNRYTMQALMDGRIEVLGGKQMRPHIHIEDMTDLYLWMLERPHRQGIWNAGFQNLSLADLARSVASVIGAQVVTEPSNDPRSYRMNSDKLLDAGFKPKRAVLDAINDVEAAYRSGILHNEDRHYNLKVMRGFQNSSSRV